METRWLMVLGAVAVFGLACGVMEPTATEGDETKAQGANIGSVKLQVAQDSPEKPPGGGGGEPDGYYVLCGIVSEAFRISGEGCKNFPQWQLDAYCYYYFSPLHACTVHPWPNEPPEQCTDSTAFDHAECLYDNWIYCFARCYEYYY